jgi:hypothetical protein
MKRRIASASSKRLGRNLERSEFFRYCGGCRRTDLLDLDDHQVGLRVAGARGIEQLGAVGRYGHADVEKPPATGAVAPRSIT